MVSSCRPPGMGPPASKEARMRSAALHSLPAFAGRRLATVASGVLSVPVLRARPDGAPEASRIRPHREEKPT
jgi:hypothetical protein